MLVRELPNPREQANYRRLLWASVAIAIYGAVYAGYLLYSSRFTVSEKANMGYQGQSEVDQLVQKAWELIGGDYEAALDLSDTHSTSGQESAELALAKSMLLRALEIDPSHTQALTDLGIIHALQREFEESIELCRKAGNANPELSKPYRCVGAVRLAQSKIPEAIAEFQKAVEVEPRDARAYFNLGLAYRLKGDYSASEHSYRKAVEEFPVFAEAWEHLAIVLRYQEKFGEAISAYERYSEIRPADAVGLYNLGEAQLAFVIRKARLDGYEGLYKSLCRPSSESVSGTREMLDSAIDNFRKAVANDPSFHQAYSMLALSLMARGDDLEANSIASIGLQKADNPVLRLVRGISSLRLGHQNEALREISVVSKNEQLRDIGDYCLDQIEAHDAESNL